MDLLISELNAFDLKHSHWEIEYFMRPKNKVLQEAVDKALLTFNLESFFTDGSVKDLEELANQVTDLVPRMYIPLLKGILDGLHKQEEQKLPINTGMVKWFREKGWKFPEFTYEYDQ